MSPARAVSSLIHAHETTAAAWGTQRAVSLPGLTVSVREMLDALRSVGGEAAVQRVRFEADERIAKIVSGWPARFNAARAQVAWVHCATATSSRSCAPMRRSTHDDDEEDRARKAQGPEDRE